MSLSSIFTAQDPVPLLQDYECFLDYLTNHSIELTKTKEVLPKKHLPPLNQKMSCPAVDATPHSQQESYPLLNLLYYLTIAGDLFHKAEGKGGKFRLEPTTERLNHYQSLTDEEKYIFLLETLWVNCDWGYLEPGTYQPASFSFLSPAFEVLGEQKPGFRIEHGMDLWEHTYVITSLLHWGYYLYYFSYFGFWEATFDDQARMRAKMDTPAKSVTLTDLGVRMMKILSQKRPIECWNIPYKRQHAFRDKMSNKDGEPFLAAFVPLFAEGKLRRTLSQPEARWQDGSFFFKVSLNRDIWRRVKLSAHHTLDDFHDAIQKAFDFDDDHLYAFFMDGKPWSHHAYWSPYVDEGLTADDVRLGELNLIKGKRMLYLFDFGDEWRLNVTLERIAEDDTPPERPVIVEEKGASPEQHAWW